MRLAREVMCIFIIHHVHGMSCGNPVPLQSVNIELRETETT